MSSKVREQLEQALLFIDKNLDQQLSAGQIARHAGMSKFHFQRLFSFYLGETLKQYFLHRRLEKVAENLFYHKNLKITEIAFDYGFENMSSFSRTFKKHFNLSPQAFRRNIEGNTLTLGSDSLRPFLKTVSSKYSSLDVTVEAQPTLWCQHKKLVNQKNFGHCKEENLLEIMLAFKEVFNSNNSSFLGIAYWSWHTNTEPQVSSDDIIPTLFGALYDKRDEDEWSAEWVKIDAGLWAVCIHHGEDKYKYQTLNNIFRSWLPGSGYELRDAMNFEIYRKCSVPNEPDRLIKQLYIPIKNVEEKNVVCFL